MALDAKVKRATEIKLQALSMGVGDVESALRWLNWRTETVLSVRQFGAMGDGQTDDTLAIQSTLDLAAEIGASVLIPPGVFITDQLLIPPGVRVFGAGVKRTVVKFKDREIPDNNNYAVIQILGTSSEPIEGVALAHMTIDGNKQGITLAPGVSGNNIECVHTEWGRNIIVHDCLIRNAVSDGLDWDSCVEVMVDRCWFYDCDGYGNHFSTGSDRVFGSNLVAVRCGNGSRGGFDFFTGVTNSGYTNCYAYECYQGFDARGSHNTFTACHVLDYWGTGAFRARADAHGTQFVGCTVNGAEDNPLSQRAYFIEADDCTLTNCAAIGAKTDGFLIAGDRNILSACRSIHAGEVGINVTGDKNLVTSSIALGSGTANLVDDGSDNVIEDNITS